MFKRSVTHFDHSMQRSSFSDGLPLAAVLPVASGCFRFVAIRCSQLLGLRWCHVCEHLMLRAGLASGLPVAGCRLAQAHHHRHAGRRTSLLRALSCLSLEHPRRFASFALRCSWNFHTTSCTVGWYTWARAFLGACHQPHPNQCFRRMGDLWSRLRHLRRLPDAYLDCG